MGVSTYLAHTEYRIESCEGTWASSSTFTLMDHPHDRFLLNTRAVRTLPHLRCAYIEVTFRARPSTAYAVSGARKVGMVVKSWGSASKATQIEEQYYAVFPKDTLGVSISEWSIPCEFGPRKCQADRARVVCIVCALSPFFHPP